MREAEQDGTAMAHGLYALTIDSRLQRWSESCNHKGIRSLLVETDSQEFGEGLGDAELSKIMHFINHQIREIKESSAVFFAHQSSSSCLG